MQQQINPRKRRMSRRFAMQAIYQWLLTANSLEIISPQFVTDIYSRQMDVDFFYKILKGVMLQQQSLNDKLSTVLDRSFDALDPIERAILLLATFEFIHCFESPHRVVINEAIELAKIYGGTDSFKYINAVLDKLMPLLRPIEWRASQPTRSSVRDDDA